MNILRWKPRTKHVILTISSDEDGGDSEAEEPPLVTPGVSLLFSGDACLEDQKSLQSQLVSNSLKKKEPPVMKAIEDQNGSNGVRINAGFSGGGRELDLAGLMDGTITGSFTHLMCRTVRIGSYKVIPKEGVLVSSLGIKLSIPSLVDENKCVSICVSIAEIVKVLIHFGKSMPVIFIYCYPSAGMRIRESLKMDPNNGPYYDPGGRETQRRITLLPNRLLEESKIALKAIFGVKKDLLAELTHNEANEILVRASPKDVSIGMIARAQNTCTGDSNSVKTIMVYPPPPEKGGIPINTEDYACLGGNQLINDIIIDFYLKYLTLRVLTPQDRDRTHLFSTFFYKRLTLKEKCRPNRSVEDVTKLTAAEKRHERVRTWTKNVNIFEKDFIIIPINEHSHWFLAIICFATLDTPVRMSDNTPISLPKEPCKLSKVRKKTIPDPLLIKKEEMKADLVNAGTIELDTQDDNSERDEAEGEEEDLEQTSEDKETTSSSQEEATTTDPAIDLPLPKSKPKTEPTTKRKGDRIYSEPIRQPCILIFDSLAGTPRTRVVATLRDYLKIEYRVKMKKDREFNKDTIKGATPKVPQQNNFIDCGLFVLQYVESFFQDPITDYRLPLKQIKEWFPLEVVDRKRETIANLLNDLMKENNIDVESLNLPTLTFGASTSFEEALANEEALASELAAEEEEEEDGMAMEYEESPEEQGSSEERDVCGGSQGDAVSLHKDSSSSELTEEPLSEDSDHHIYNSSFSAIGASETVGLNESASLYSSSDNIVPLVSYPDSEEEDTLVENSPGVDNIKRINQDLTNGPVKRLKICDNKSRKSGASSSSGGSPHSRQ